MLTVQYWHSRHPVDLWFGVRLGLNAMLKKLREFFGIQKKVDLRSLLTARIDTPLFLDLLWSAYSKSKDPAFVRRIISVLDRKDIVRDKMEPLP